MATKIALALVRLRLLPLLIAGWMGWGGGHLPLSDNLRYSGNLRWGR